MSDYISRQALISEIEDEHCWGCDWMAGGICKNCRINKFLQEIKAVPPVDIPKRNARWIELENPNYSPFDTTSHEYDLLCSLCGATHNGPNRNFCPNCGADMREEQHG